MPARAERYIDVEPGGRMIFRFTCEHYQTIEMNSSFIKHEVRAFAYLFKIQDTTRFTIVPYDLSSVPTCKNKNVIYIGKDNTDNEKQAY